MQFGDQRLRRRRGEFDRGSQGNARHRYAALGILFEHAFSFVDEAEGVLEKNPEGRIAMTRVTLRPAVEFAAPPSQALITELHHLAHEKCFSPNSARTEVSNEPRQEPSPRGE